MYRSLVVSLVVLFSSLFFGLTTAAQPNFDHDNVDADCATRATPEACYSDIKLMRECPISCPHSLIQPEKQAMASGFLEDEDDFYVLEATDKVTSKPISFENYQGYITVIAALPKQKAIAQFYYEMLEHLHDVYPYTLEILIVPQERGFKVNLVDNPKVKIASAENHPVLLLLNKALRGAQLAPGPIFYLIGANGNSVEAFVSTTMPDFQRYLRYHFEKELNSKSEF